MHVGSFYSLYRLTAFVNKVFCQAKVYINDDIDENIVCQSLRFLESIQAADGSFPEGYAVRHREMIVSELCYPFLGMIE